MENDNGKFGFYISETYSTNPMLAKRFDLRICTHSANNAGVCLAGMAFAYQVLKDIANGIKSLSNQNNCRSDFATIHVYNNIDVYWQAGEITGACDTTALTSTIEGSLDEHVGKTNGKKICAFQCLKLTHGGKWTFYLKFGTDRYLVKYTDCSSRSGEYINCTSGGENSVGKNL
ncbi:uncharacterized protein RJT20DRAFT_130159 [Scheffersomyces xylosifermentans]|uniref:uncharacterized protein n=1 Tax=Scheffersomyces xylosifermentans TaxID=1304137 RepID=UPI00315DA7D5